MTFIEELFELAVLQDMRPEDTWEWRAAEELSRLSRELDAARQALRDIGAYCDAYEKPNAAVIAQRAYSALPAAWHTPRPEQEERKDG